MDEIFILCNFIYVSVYTIYLIAHQKSIVKLKINLKYKCVCDSSDAPLPQTHI
jgi:hypothetical protein